MFMIPRDQQLAPLEAREAGSLDRRQRRRASKARETVMEVSGLVGSVGLAVLLSFEATLPLMLFAISAGMLSAWLGTRPRPIN